LQYADADPAWRREQHGLMRDNDPRNSTEPSNIAGSTASTASTEKLGVADKQSGRRHYEQDGRRGASRKTSGRLSFICYYCEAPRRPAAVRKPPVLTSP
jgi:hypothetical protein